MRQPTRCGLWCCAGRVVLWRRGLALQQNRVVAERQFLEAEELKALSARVMRAAPDDAAAHQMRALVLLGLSCPWEVGSRSVAELMEAATHYERTAALCDAPAGKAHFARMAMLSRSEAGRHN